MCTIDGVADADSLGGGIFNFVAAVVVECRDDDEPITGAEVLLLACSGFVLDGEKAFYGAERCGVVVDGTVVVFPR